MVQELAQTFHVTPGVLYTIAVAAHSGLWGFFAGLLFDRSGPPVYGPVSGAERATEAHPGAVLGGRNRDALPHARARPGRIHPEIAGRNSAKTLNRTSLGCIQ